MDGKIPHKGTKGENIMESEEYRVKGFIKSLNLER
jgi:hypothetical protein